MTLRDARWHADQAERLLERAADLIDGEQVTAYAARSQAHAQLAAALVLIDDADPGVLIPLPART